MLRKLLLSATTIAAVTFLTWELVKPGDPPFKPVYRQVAPEASSVPGATCLGQECDAPSRIRLISAPDRAG